MCCSHALVSGPTSKTQASDGGLCSGQAVDDVVSRLFWLATLTCCTVRQSQFFIDHPYRCEHNLSSAKPFIFVWLYKLKLLYNMTHIFLPCPQTSNFIPVGQLFILYTVLHDLKITILVICKNHFISAIPTVLLSKHPPEFVIQ